MVTILVKIAEDTIFFVAVHFSTLFDDVATAKCFDREQHITHGRFRGDEFKLQSESEWMRRRILLGNCAFLIYLL